MNLSSILLNNQSFINNKSMNLVGCISNMNFEIHCIMIELHLTRNSRANVCTSPCMNTSEGSFHLSTRLDFGNQNISSWSLHESYLLYIYVPNTRPWSMHYILKELKLDLGVLKGIMDEDYVPPKKKKKEKSKHVLAHLTSDLDQTLYESIIMVEPICFCIHQTFNIYMLYI